MNTRPPTVGLSVRDEVVAEFERLRAPGLRIADAALSFARRTEELEWALWATDPDEDRGNFNQDYADEKLALCIPAWRVSRDLLRAALDDDSEAVR